MSLDGEKIRAAMSEVRRRGWRVTDGVTIDPMRRQCCPMGALSIIECNVPHSYAPLDDVAAALGFPLGEVSSFALGFDGETPDAALDDIDAYLLGVAVRAEVDEHNADNAAEEAGIARETDRFFGGCQ